MVHFQDNRYHDFSNRILISPEGHDASWSQDAIIFILPAFSLPRFAAIVHVLGVVCLAALGFAGHSSPFLGFSRWLEDVAWSCFGTACSQDVMNVSVFSFEVTGTLISMGCYTTVLSLFFRQSPRLKLVSASASSISLLLGMCIMMLGSEGDKKGLQEVASWVLVEQHWRQKSAPFGSVSWHNFAQPTMGIFAIKTHKVSWQTGARRSWRPGCRALEFPFLCRDLNKRSLAQGPGFNFLVATWWR